MRIAIAIAGYLCSTDETFEQIIVTEEHVDEAIKLLLELYDNPTFKLKEYVEEEKKCNTLTQEDLDVLEEAWKTSSILLDYLFKNPQTTKVNLQMVSGVDNDRFNRIIYKLAKQNLIRIDKSFIFTTNKYTKGFNQMDRSVVIHQEVVIKLDD
jgi:DNA replicative helicase MCM subunit Mcm2 (Cdc46/Mcm family)